MSPLFPSPARLLTRDADFLSPPHSSPRSSSFSRLSASFTTPQIPSFNPSLPTTRTSSSSFTPWVLSFSSLGSTIPTSQRFFGLVSLEARAETLSSTCFGVITTHQECVDASSFSRSFGHEQFSLTSLPPPSIPSSDFPTRSRRTSRIILLRSPSSTLPFPLILKLASPSFFFRRVSLSLGFR